MPVTINGTSGLTLTSINATTLTADSLDLSSPLPVAEGGTGVTSLPGGPVSLTGTQTLTNKTLQGTKEVLVGLGAGSNIDLSLGNYFSKTISGTTTFTVSNVPSSGIGNSFILELTNGGSATVNWWANVKWPGGTAPTLTASGRDILGFYTTDAGTIWNGLLLGKDVK